MQGFLYEAPRRVIRGDGLSLFGSARGARCKGPASPQRCSPALPIVFVRRVPPSWLSSSRHGLSARVRKRFGGVGGIRTHDDNGGCSSAPSTTRPPHRNHVSLLTTPGIRHHLWQPRAQVGRFRALTDPRAFVGVSLQKSLRPPPPGATRLPRCSNSGGPLAAPGWTPRHLTPPAVNDRFGIYIPRRAERG